MHTTGTDTAYTTRIRPGWTAYGSDNEKIGDIAAVEGNYFIIEKGFIFTTDIYVPMSAVASVDEDERVYLTMTKAQIEDGDWSSPPDADDDVWEGHAARGTATTAATAATADSDVLERREERLVVDKTTGKAGSVRVGKHVVEDQQSVDVPVSREEVELNRRAVDRPATTGDLHDEAIDVPVYEERVSAGKEARVVEELEVDKTTRTGTERVSDTVRREEFDVDTDVDRPAR